MRTARGSAAPARRGIRKTATAAPVAHPVRRRSVGSTKERVLQAALHEFCAHGLKGARVESIARRARLNVRMLYHYFGSKEGIYLAVLERAYEWIRIQQEALHLETLDPLEGMRRLIDFCFAHFGSNGEFLQLVNNENLLRARYLKRIKRVQEMTMPLVTAIQDLLDRGAAEGLFRKDADPVQLYVSILALSVTHVSSRHTLSTIFRTDLADPAWLAQRREQVQAMVLAYLGQHAELPQINGRSGLTMEAAF